jgi:hypothetical protein
LNQKWCREGPLPPLCSVIDHMSLLSLATARFVAAKNKALPHAVVENEKPNFIALR